ncbi:sensor domain-containing diguanylate cyclase [Enterobacter sp. RHBSTW-00175]|uniref:sensor domain-containing diguanylate cyclase n=1 Tax=Enterobacter sp. RHBSTW-00175 TaxID=2742639 RepID=UPI0015E9BDDC|nr:sensor domain-containing diguanylate cyclase [Enterobacter sp. RHBSTW-00175]QMR76150.1 diguanylate cyclase [Enterobacter sp. RHBSTW-00175]HDR2755916.1 diguanylate cyclase [Enterobacter asburiae]HDR2864587.1 diguanylate cyclase [Enterobacter asburiae]
MALHSRKLSFTRPIMVSFAGILLSFILVAVFITLSQRSNFLNDYHKINGNFTHNLAVIYTESILHENDYILGRAATFFARNDRLNQTINTNPGEGLQVLMHLQNLMPTVSSISLADTQGHYLRAPEVLPTDKSKTFDARTRPWFIGQAEASTFSRYTHPYMDYFTGHPTVTLFKPVISPEGRLKGTLAFHLDLTSMGFTLRQMVAPVQGEFFIVERDGTVVLHPDTGALFKPYVSEALMDKMTSGEGHLYDPESKTWFYYYSFTNPDWFVIYRVADSTLIGITQHETAIVGWGLALASLIIILFGLYLRHASRTVLMNIINAIKTGDVSTAPRLEAMLSHTIQSNKERELAYVRQATHDALTGCKNRRAFDNDIAELLNNHQPFALALVDIDNFKSINDTWGHLSGDIVLRNVAREGLQVMQPHNVSVYRYGGEEFAVIFRSELFALSHELLDTWRIAVEKRAWREENLHVTFSAGLGEWHFEPLEQFIGTVDGALYKAKQQGKNRILQTSDN